MWDLRNQSPASFLDQIQGQGHPPAVARRWTSAVFGHRVDDPSLWTSRFEIPKKFTEVVRANPWPRLTRESHVRSSVDGFEKLRFRTGDGLAIETVLIPLARSGAVSVCLSSQVGCPMACAFCATARMLTRRNLATWEMIDQFLQARDLVRSQGRRVTGAVFMGMGEPFLNYDRVIAAAELLRCSYAGAIGAGKITISTVGLVREIDRYTREGHPFRLSISLGAATDALRQELVPVAARTSVAEVMAAADRHARDRRDRVMLAYVCIAGVNMAEADAIALGQLVGSTPIRLDLIDVTDPTGRFHPPTEPEMTAFRDALTRHVGQPVVRRYSGGKNIAAACGTLAGTG